jgi:hypothetical protein
VVGQEFEELGGEAGLVERPGDPEQAGDEKQQRPIDRRDHPSAGDLPAREQQGGNDQRTGFPRQGRREEYEERQQGNRALDRLVAVERVNGDGRRIEGRREHRLGDALVPLQPDDGKDDH